MSHDETTSLLLHKSTDGTTGGNNCLDPYGSVLASLSSSSSSNDPSSLKQQQQQQQQQQHDSQHGSLSQHIIPSAKTIGMLGSVAIAVNSLAGPAILQLPFTYQHSGLIPTTLGLVLVGGLASLVSLHMAHVVSQIPHNINFILPMEFSDPFRIFWNEAAYYVTLLLYYLCVICINVAAMVDVSQIVDSILGHGSPFGTYAISLYPHGIQLHHWQRGPCTRTEVKLGQCVPFENSGDIVLTLGYVVAALVFLPMCLMDLKENTVGQIVGFIIMCTVVLVFATSFVQYDLKWKHVPLWGDDALAKHGGAAWGTMLGVVLFNYALVLAVPAWLHEKKSSVSVPTVICGSTMFATIMYISVGLLGALAIPNVNDNMLDPMLSGAFGTWLQVTAGLFGFWNIGLDIPLFSVLARYNFTKSGLFPNNTHMANVFVVYLPWALAWLFYQGTSIGVLLEWGGVLFTSAVAFVLPLYLALRALQQETDAEHYDRCTVPVYGPWITSRRAKVISLYILLALASISIGGAIVGQTSRRHVKQSLMDNPDYVNSTLPLKEYQLQQQLQQDEQQLQQDQQQLQQDQQQLQHDQQRLRERERERERERQRLIQHGNTTTNSSTTTNNGTTTRIFGTKTSTSTFFGTRRTWNSTTTTTTTRTATNNATPAPIEGSANETTTTTATTTTTTPEDDNGL